uniref:Cyclin C-terminal domain-containing protein n=1 Tax=Caenorhabditis japonica TaxID=281687 RepID=A0A8R1IXB4_CAEJA
MCKIIDYLLLEIDSFEFSYRTIAAAVLFVNYEPTSAVERATGFTSEQLSQVIRYVRPVCNVFARLRDDTEVLPVHSQINADDTHNIQVHIKFQDYEDLVKEEREKLHGRARQH